MSPDVKAVLYTSAYVPAEWIAAHGFEPIRLVPDGRAEAPRVLNRQGVCPFLKAFVTEALEYRDAAAIVMTTTCDQMRRGLDIVTRAGRIPGFLVDVPHAAQNPVAQRLYIDELQRLSCFLTSLGGAPPSSRQLAEVMLRTGAEWQRQTEACRCSPASERRTGVPVALVGPSLRKQDFGLFDIIRDCGGFVALDATESGERGAHRSFDRRVVENDPLLELADAYLNGIADVFFRPNDAFYGWLVPRVKERNIQAVILHRYLWCDLWHVECERLKTRTGLPVLGLDVGGDLSPAEGRIRGRIGAFMEMLT
jgi:benzoyl-CoA reductase/2-hydroxyglutaryl-CoA dehydratase subunit BcrC/BadD/HgdB